MSLDLADAAVIVSLREGALAAEACSADDAEAKRRLAVERCELLSVHFVHDIAVALIAAENIAGTTFVEASSVHQIRAWAECQVDDAEREARELRAEEDGGDDGIGVLA